MGRVRVEPGGDRRMEVEREESAVVALLQMANGVIGAGFREAKIP